MNLPADRDPQTTSVADPTTTAGPARDTRPQGAEAARAPEFPDRQPPCPAPSGPAAVARRMAVDPRQSQPARVREQMQQAQQ